MFMFQINTRVCLTLSLISLLLLVRKTESARILAVLPLFASSHHIVLQPILKALAQAGHEVVSYTTFPLDKPYPNYTEIVLDSAKLTTKQIDEHVLRLIEMPHWRCLDNLLPLHEEIIHRFFGNNKIQQLLQSKEKFDLLITETFTAQEFALIFGHVFNIPVIGIQTFATTLLPNLNLGNTLSMASIPDGCAPYSNKMNFMERFLNSFSLVRGIHMYYNDYIPLVEGKMKKYVPNMPPLRDLINNVSLMFINDHMTADYAQPRPPNMIPIGGIHIAAEKPLPKDIKEFMDGATDGAIVFSLGTMVPDDVQSQEHFDMLKKVFGKLRQRVLWKTRKENIGALPDNIKAVKWMPQRDVLAHPNCVLFITHGGLASLHETIYNGVPVIGIPFFADQHRNVGLYKAKEVGVRLLHTDITEETMSVAIQTVLGDPKYRDNMKRLSQIYKDRPMSPAQSVVFWTEYVLRHQGARHLRPASTQLAWYQLALVDVIGAVIAVTIFIASIIFLIIRIILSVFLRRTKPVITPKKVN